MASLSEQKYLTLRKRLDQFGFKQPLAIESLPLVEKLFQAFIQTTEELKKAKEVLAKLNFWKWFDLFDLDPITTCSSTCDNFEFFNNIFIRSSI